MGFINCRPQKFSNEGWGMENLEEVMVGDNVTHTKNLVKVVQESVNMNEK